MTIWQTVRSFLKIGTIGFGGGSALIPVVEKEIVENKQWISDEDYKTTTIVANITPGALPVKLGALWNKKYSLASAFSVALPGTFLVVFLLTLFSLIGERAVEYIEFASVGISGFIILLLYLYIVKVQKEGKVNEISRQYLLITIAAFLLTGGKGIRSVISVLFKIPYESMPAPLLAISTLDLMIISVFSICFTANTKSKARFIYAFPLSLLYALSKGKAGILSEYSGLFIWAMIISVVIAVIYDSRTSKKQKNPLSFDYSHVKNIFLFLAVPVVLSTICIIISGEQKAQVMQYITNALVSTVTSFGGGEAYVSVADGFFVQTGLIEPQVYYSQVVAVANALPGPILVKVASAIGYVLGCEMQSIGFGWFVALTGFSITVSMSSVIALIVFLFFDSLKDNPLLLQIKRYILPVVCGMLVSTILSMLFEGLKVTSVIGGMNPFIGLALMALLFGVSLFLHKKYRLNDVILLLLCGGTTLLLFGLLGGIA